MTNLLYRLQQKGAIGRFSALGIDRRAKKALDSAQTALRKYIFHCYAQTALHSAWRGGKGLRAVRIQSGKKCFFITGGWYHSAQQPRRIGAAFLLWLKTKIIQKRFDHPANQFMVLQSQFWQWFSGEDLKKRA